VRYKDTGKLASTSVAATGYVQVGVWYKGKSRTFNVHRLVAEAFLPNPYSLPQVNHKDENKRNNHFTNLEWCTPKYNSAYSRQRHPEREAARWHNGGVSSGRKRARRICAFRDGVLIKTYESVADAARDMKCHRTTISSVANGCYGRKSARGYKWVYADAQMPYNAEEEGAK
jgi:hypothetical protein